MDQAIKPLHLPPPSILLMGPAGTGKTSSLVTALQSGLKVRMLATEPTAPARVIDETLRRKLDPKLLQNFDWCIVSPSPPKWDALKDSARLIGSMSLKDIANLSQGIAKPETKQWMEFLNAISDFPGTRAGKSLGDATEWGSDTLFTIDGLSGVNFMSRSLTVGLKPNPAPGEWGVMQNNILDVVRKLATDCKGFFCLIAHVERETNDITGASNITVSTLGAKLAPKIPPWFTSVVLTKKIESTFSWSTSEMNVDTKNGDLPLAKDLQPSFAPLIEGYRKRMAAITEAVGR